MKRKIAELTGGCLLVFSLFSLCVDYKTILLGIIGLLISIVSLLVAMVLINTHYKDGRWI